LLVNKPLYYLENPSLALVQLRSNVLDDREVVSKFDIKFCHPEHDFAQCLGLELGNRLADAENALAGEAILHLWVFGGKAHKWHLMK
tara:strand:+ start:258 stop:518 length:261 start_codon:yes stop_codon:yes gene_type:complete